MYRICLLTGDNGKDATSLFRDPRLLGHLHAAPYGAFEPSLAFVAEDAIGVGGYIVGARDSHAFGRRLESDWWPRLRARYPDPSPEVSEEQWTRDQRAAHQIHHPQRTPDELAGRYPSHLHINLLPRLQARGLGRRLIETLIVILREQGAAGVHLRVGLCNPRAAEFYRRVGFTELSATDRRTFAMDLRNPA